MPVASVSPSRLLAVEAAAASGRTRMNGTSPPSLAVSCTSRAAASGRRGNRRRAGAAEATPYRSRDADALRQRFSGGSEHPSKPGLPTLPGSPEQPPDCWGRSWAVGSASGRPVSSARPDAETMHRTSAPATISAAPSSRSAMEAGSPGPHAGARQSRWCWGWRAGPPRAAAPAREVWWRANSVAVAVHTIADR